ncbi:hypothetical protein QQ704_08055 [Klebsiella pneumoniae]|uniref:hypothetical protein n=3 Tax=Klebsiella pneumoniae TaxID=573 RepID=UPI002551D64F|nr:hypothetical protein [Klebsiella pneumoniae]MDL2126581.1 hypothetical protein [Klebsiella pneumoniae]
MSIEFDPYSLVVSINNLNATLKEVDYFKDYILPIVSLIVSGIFGYIIAIRGYKWQECVQNERIKVDTINKTIMMFQDMQNNLVAIKATYSDGLSHHPLQRAGYMPFIICDETIMYCESERLVQVGLSDNTGSKAWKLLHKKNKCNIKATPWLQAPTIFTVVSNYNHLIVLLKTRNQLDLDVKSMLSEKYGSEYGMGMTEDKLYEALGRSLFVKYFDATELLILQVDNMIISISDFLTHYPNEVSLKVNKKYLSNYKVIVNYINETTPYISMLKRTPALDIKVMSSLVRMDTVEAMRKYRDYTTIQTN